MSDEQTFTISQINKRIGEALSDSFPAPFWVVGEVQGFERDAPKGATRRWGQIYFELIEKEKGADSAKASTRAIMWGDAREQIARRLEEASEKIALRDGLQVRFLCAVDFYWPRASLQLKVLDVDPQFTLGDMEKARQELIERLKREGAYDLNRAALMPVVPQVVGLITSDGSAAYHDFTDELKKSGYAFDVRFWDARMQGDETEESVCRALKALGEDPEVDVIALVRGGGSRSDLIWFDKEKIAFAVANCPKPVVTGIGHEIDLSVADLVAHESRKTPTAAAQFLVGRVEEFEAKFLETAAGIFRTASEALQEGRRGLAESVRTWRHAATLLIQSHRSELGAAVQGVKSGVRRRIDLARQDLAGVPDKLARSARQKLRIEEERLKGFRRECELKDPRRLLERGYSLVTVNGKLVKDVAAVKAGDELEAQVRNGFLTGKVISTRKVEK